MKTSMSNAQRMMHECVSTTVNLSERFWQVVVIDKIIRSTYGTPQSFELNMAYFAAADDNLETVEARTWLKSLSPDMEDDIIRYETSLSPMQAAKTMTKKSDGWKDNLELPMR